MFIKELSADELTHIYNTHMINDFPSSELKPLERILYTMSIKLCYAFGLYEGNSLKGYSIFIIPENCDYALLDYFAILSENRGMGYGHSFFSSICPFFNEHFPELKGIFIECEDINKAKDATERTTRSRRISFYKNNGCIDTPLCSCLFGVEYVILYLPLLSSETYTTPSPDTLYTGVNQIYRSMFKQHHYQNNVKLWKI